MRFFRLPKLQTNGTKGLNGINDDVSIFSGKVTHGRHLFFFSFAQWSEEDDTITSKVAKGKGKCAEKQDNESTVSFQNYDSRRL